MARMYRRGRGKRGRSGARMDRSKGVGQVRKVAARKVPADTRRPIRIPTPVSIHGERLTLSRIPDDSTAAPAATPWGDLSMFLRIKGDLVFTDNYDDVSKPFPVNMIRQACPVMYAAKSIRLKEMTTTQLDAGTPYVSIISTCYDQPKVVGFGLTPFCGISDLPGAKQGLGVHDEPAYSQFNPFFETGTGHVSMQRLGGRDSHLAESARKYYIDAHPEIAEGQAFRKQTHWYAEMPNTFGKFTVNHCQQHAQLKCLYDTCKVTGQVEIAFDKRIEYSFIDRVKDMFNPMSSCHGVAPGTTLQPPDSTKYVESGPSVPLWFRAIPNVTGTDPTVAAAVGTDYPSFTKDQGLQEMNYLQELGGVNKFLGRIAKQLRSMKMWVVHRPDFNIRADEDADESIRDGKWLPMKPGDSITRLAFDPYEVHERERTYADGTTKQFEIAKKPHRARIGVVEDKGGNDRYDEDVLLRTGRYALAIKSRGYNNFDAIPEWFWLFYFRKYHHSMVSGTNLLIGGTLEERTILRKIKNWHSEVQDSTKFFNNPLDIFSAADWTTLREMVSKHVVIASVVLDARTAVSYSGFHNDNVYGGLDVTKGNGREGMFGRQYTDQEGYPPSKGAIDEEDD